MISVSELTEQQHVNILLISLMLQSYEVYRQESSTKEEIDMFQNTKYTSDILGFLDSMMHNRKANGEILPFAEF